MADTNAKIKTDMQTLGVDSPLVNLFKLDVSVVGGGVHYFTPGPIGGAIVMFNGISYIPLPVKVEGMEWKGDGKMPRPTISVSNVTLALMAEVNSHNDLVGATVTRIRTYKKYLDGQGGADPNAKFPEDIYIVERKIKGNKYLLQFELKAAVDLEGILIPQRQVLPVCQYIYRYWNGSAFVYDPHNSCPYTDTDYYDETGAATTADKDKCGGRLFHCKLRFPSTHNPDDQLPGRFFPGVGNFGRPYRR